MVLAAVSGEDRHTLFRDSQGAYGADGNGEFRGDRALRQGNALIDAAEQACVVLSACEREDQE